MLAEIEVPAEKDWPHAPVHRLDIDGVFMVTGATLHKKHLFKTPDKLSLLENQLLKLAKDYHWQLEAWSVFSNHYHFVVRSLPEAGDLGQMVSQLHTETGRDINRVDNTEGRDVWYNF